jgi:hypothetical protein
MGGVHGMIYHNNLHKHKFRESQMKFTLADDNLVQSAALDMMWYPCFENSLSLFDASMLFTFLTLHIHGTHCLLTTKHSCCLVK